MIIKEADVLPHALINHVPTKLGEKGEILEEYVTWLTNRIKTKRARKDYNPILHIDVYGTMGIAFNRDTDAIVEYIMKLEKIARPFTLRIEGPVDYEEREATMKGLRDITAKLKAKGSKAEIVADEWCNTLEDIKYFADNKAGTMAQIKTPDLGGVNNVAEAIIYCKDHGMGAYCGGTCNETNISAQTTTNIGIACKAAQVLAKPGSVTPHSKFKGQVYVLTKEEGGRHTAFLSNYRPQFYFRTTDVTGVITLPAGVDMVMPGDNVELTVELIHPIAMEKGTKFSIREGGRTVGAGTVSEIIK